MSYVMGHKVSPETRAKLSATLKGKSAWNKGIPMTEAMRLALLKANLGRPLSEEHKARLSAVALGRRFSEEHRGRISASLKGKPKSDALKEADRQAHIGIFPSAETRAKLSAMHKGKQLGPLNQQWKGGITPVNTLIRNSPEYMAWRTAVFERDHYTCQECGEHGSMGHTVRLEAHHIHEFAKYPDERFVVDNGVTLCLKCHKAKRAKVAA